MSLPGGLREGATLLLVEDEPAFRADAATALTRAGWRVEAAATTSAALDRIDQGLAIDLLVSRVRMPRGHPHGFALARMVRHRLPGVRVLLHAVGYDDLPEAERTDPPGTLIPRPARGADLVVAIERALGDPPEPAPQSERQSERRPRQAGQR